MEDVKMIEIGKKIILRPVKKHGVLRAVGKPQVRPGHFQRSGTATNSKKKLAQDLYYSYNGRATTEEFKVPVHKRLGGPVTARRSKKWFHNQEWVKPRIKVSRDGLTTQNYRQKAQRRMHILQKRLHYKLHPTNFQVQFRTNNRNRYPQLFHSVKASLDEGLQQEIKILMDDCVRSTDINDEVPLNNEDATELKLHDRFSLYP